MPDLGQSATMRAADTGDAPAIAALHTSSWQHTYRGILDDAFLDGALAGNRLSLWEGRLGEPDANRCTLVAEARSRVVGFVCLFANEDPSFGALLDNLHVEAGRRGSGLGRSLTGAALAWLEARAPDAGLYLWVYHPNPGASGFYTHLGAREVERTTQASPDGGEVTAIRYAWSAPAWRALASER